MWVPDPRFEEPNLFIPGKKPVATCALDTSNKMTNKLFGFYVNSYLNRNLSNTQFALPNYRVSPEFFSEPREISQQIAFPAPPAGDLSYVFVVRINSIGPGVFSNGNGVALVSSRTYDAARSPTVCWSDHVFAGYGKIWAGADSSGLAHGRALDAPFAFGQWQTLAVRFGTTASEIAFALNGQMQSVMATPVAGEYSSTWTGDFLNLGFHNMWSTYANLGQVDFGAFFVWSRKLMDAEMASLTRDPYQFLIPA